jgi:hypothetical protein
MVTLGCLSGRKTKSTPYKVATEKPQSDPLLGPALLDRGLDEHPVFGLASSGGIQTFNGAFEIPKE